MMKNLIIFMRRGMGHMSRRGLIWVAFLGVLAVAGRASAAVSTDLDSYVLFATGEGLSDNATPLSFKGGNVAGTGYVLGGNVGVNRADGNLGNSTQMIAVGLNGRFVMSPETQLVGDSIQLGPEAVVYDVFTNQQAGTGWSTLGVINGTVSGFTPPIFDPMPQLFDPSFTAGSIDIDVASGTVYNGGTPLTPGNYQDLSVKDGATIYLTAGTYTFRRFNTGQNFTVYTVPGTIVQVTGDTNPNSLDMQFNGNGSFVGSANPAIESVAEFRYLGTDVQFSDSSTFWGVILAPNASISLGRENTLYGRFIGQQINSDFNDNIYYRIPEPATLILLGLGGLVLVRKQK